VGGGAELGWGYVGRLGSECRHLRVTGGSFDGREVVLAGVGIVISGDVAMATGSSGHEMRGCGLG
jgi:hypothetical protein